MCFGTLAAPFTSSFVYLLKYVHDDLKETENFQKEIFVDHPVFYKDEIEDASLGHYLIIGRTGNDFNVHFISLVDICQN